MSRSRLGSRSGPGRYAVCSMQREHEDGGGGWPVRRLQHSADCSFLNTIRDLQIECAIREARAFRLDQVQASESVTVWSLEAQKCLQRTSTSWSMTTILDRLQAILRQCKLRTPSR